MYISGWQSKDPRLIICRILATSPAAFRSFHTSWPSEHSGHCSRLDSRKSRPPLFMPRDWAHRLQHDAAKKEMWYNKGCDAPFISSKWQSNPSIFCPICRQMSIYGLKVVSPPVWKYTRLEETKPDSGKINVHVWTVPPLPEGFHLGYNFAPSLHQKNAYPQCFPQ